MEQPKRARFLDHIDKLTKTDRENVHTMLRVGAELHGRDGFNLVRNEESNEWEITVKVDKGNAGISNHQPSFAD